MNQLENVDVTRASQLIREGALLLDVREQDEWDAGHAPLARHVPLASVPDILDELSGGRLVVCVCRSGGRSARAGHFLLDSGVPCVNLDGGMKAWRDAGAPLVCDEGEPRVA
jgi:rhodanese-related sulfurtransferase